MMRLRHLFHNPALAEMLLANWGFDADAAESLGDFRISANAVYPFRQAGQVCYLRFCPTSEKSREAVLSELEFIDYLRSEGFGAAEPIVARSGEHLVAQTTPWGAYLATAFREAPGAQVSQLHLDSDIAHQCGATLGRLHRLSAAFGPRHQRRRSQGDVLSWMEATLQTLGAQASPLTELATIRHHLASLPSDSDSYGLIHYDFEPDNLFYHAPSRTCHVIDFDDAMYAWYALDLQIAIDSLADSAEQDKLPSVEAAFHAGYDSQNDLDDRLAGAGPLFSRFISLYRYVRTARACQERWDNEPAWMISLRARLSSRMARDAASFGQPIPTASR